MRWRRCARRSISAAIMPLEARRTLAPQALPGPTGETNELRYRGRGVFVCISPWNFPLSIFLGQVTAALAAGNAVVAKPAEQTPLIAARSGAHPARGRRSARPRCISCPATAGVGAALVADPRSRRRRLHRLDRGRRARSTARSPPRMRPIVPLIAETGGINPMIVDATALPEQVDRRRHRPPRSARPASAARRCGCCACRRTWPSASSR